MTQITVTDVFGDTRTIDATDGDTLMQAITGAGFDDMEARCGGNCKCATCHVHLEAGYEPFLPPMGECETGLLTQTSGYQEGSSRLACQIGVNGDLEGLKVTIVAN
ncbi:MAG: 2Fe-2S iron-sulfur cluster-binding protein [Gammaproteobacteria bacterium]